MPIREEVRREVLNQLLLGSRAHISESRAIARELIAWREWYDSNDAQRIVRDGYTVEMVVHPMVRLVKITTPTGQEHTIHIT